MYESLRRRVVVVRPSFSTWCRHTLCSRALVGQASPIPLFSRAILSPSLYRQSVVPSLICATERPSWTARRVLLRGGTAARYFPQRVSGTRAAHVSSHTRAPMLLPWFPPDRTIQYTAGYQQARLDGNVLRQSATCGARLRSKRPCIATACSKRRGQHPKDVSGIWCRTALW